MSAGIVMLALSCAAAYVYLFYLKPKETEQAASNSDGMRTYAPTAVAPMRKSVAGDGVEAAEVGDFVQIQDAGPQMLQISAQITHCHLIKTGFTRRTILEGDTGTGTCWITVYPNAPHQVWVSLQPIPAEKLPISKTQLQSLTADTDCTVQWEGMTYTFNGKESRLFCPDGNELEAEEMTSWRFQNRDAALQFLRDSDGAYKGYLCAAVPRQQVSLVKHVV